MARAVCVSVFAGAAACRIWGVRLCGGPPVFADCAHGFHPVFFYVLVRKVLKGTRFQWMELSFIGLFLMMQLMPSAVEGFYWYNGAVNYTFFYAILMTMAGLTWYCDQTERWGVRAGLTGLLLLMGFILAGGNQVTSFVGILFYLICGAVRSLSREKKKSLSLFLVGLVITAGFILNVTAPGTAVRQATCPDRPGVVGTIVLSISYTLIYMTDWLQPFFLVCLAAVAPSAWDVARTFRRETGFSYPCPLAAVIAAGAVMTAMYCPSNYAQGFSGNYRLINVTYFIFVILMLILLVYLLGRCIPLYGIENVSLAEGNIDAGRLLEQTISGDLSGRSLFTLGIAPYITASILVQITASIMGSGSRSRISPKKMNRITILLTLLFAFFQAVVHVHDLYYHAS